MGIGRGCYDFGGVDVSATCWPPGAGQRQTPRELEKAAGQGGLGLKSVQYLEKPR